MKKVFLFYGERLFFINVCMKKDAAGILSVNSGSVFRSGGDKEDRTPDLLHAMQALSQLSYTPMRL